MPPLAYPTNAVIDGWVIEEFGPKNGEQQVEVLEADNSSCTREFLVPWAARFAFAAWCVGKVALYESGGDTYLTRLMPQTHTDPDEPDLAWIATKIVEMRGHQWVDELPGTDNDPRTLPQQVYDRCRVKVLFEHPPFELGEDGDTVSEQSRYVEYPAESEPGGEYLQLPGAAFFRVAEPGGGLEGSPLDGLPVPQNVGKIVPQEVFRVMWHRLPITVWDGNKPLYQRIFGTGENTTPYLGAVNSAEFYGKPEGTVLMTGLRPFKKKSPTGIGYDLYLQYEFTYRPSGWNWAFAFNVGDLAGTGNGWYMLSTIEGDFQYASTVADGQSIYNARDLNNLFVVGAVSP